MTELDLPLHGPALYNPHLLSKEELLGLFSARQALLEELLDDIRSAPPGEPAQHHLVLGQRGMGKTMLLRRIQFAVEDDPELQDRWLALSFPEEQYNVATLSDFWLNCIDALSDTLERQDSSRPLESVEKVVEGLDDAVAALRKEAEDVRADRALDVLASAASVLDRRLLLLVDNADLVLDRIRKQDWALREVLSSQPAVTFLGASAAAIESTYEYGKAFYDFFRIHNLAGLTIEQARTLLLRYAEAQKEYEVSRIVDEKPGRLRTLHTLTGGNPRTLALLFNIFVQGPDGDVRSDIERLLDQCTPLYKARFEALPAQAQQVVDALALHWDPASAGELAEVLRMPVNKVSAQLNRLVNQGVIERVPYDPESKTGFQLAERFFNIWYLMRASRRVRRRLIWLVEFLRMFYSQDELRSRAEQQLRLTTDLSSGDRLRHAEYSFALASAFEDTPFRNILERSAFQTLKGHDDLRRLILESGELGGEDSGLKSRAQYLERFEAIRARLGGYVEQGRIEAQLAEHLLRAPLELEQKEWIARTAAESEDLAETPGIADLSTFEQAFEHLQQLDEGVRHLLRALDAGHMTSFDDMEGAELAEAAFDVRGLVALAAAIRFLVTESSSDLDALVASLEDAVSPLPWLVWLHKCGRELEDDRLRHAIDRAWALSNGTPAYMSELASLLEQELERLDEAEEAFRAVIRLAPSDAGAWFRLGEVLRKQHRISQAIEAYRKVVELEPVNATAWSSLAGCLRAEGSIVESEEALRTALQLEPKVAAYYLNLSLFLEHEDWSAQTEEEFLRKSIAWLLSKITRDPEEARRLAQEVIVSKNASALVNYSDVLTSTGKTEWREVKDPDRRFLRSWVADLPEEKWLEIVEFFRRAVASGRARVAVDALDVLDLGERWRPLREACEALIRKNPKYLRRVAPEVREPAEAILQQLTIPPEENG